MCVCAQVRVFFSGIFLCLCVWYSKHGILVMIIPPALEIFGRWPWLKYLAKWWAWPKISGILQSNFRRESCESWVRSLSITPSAGGGNVDHNVDMHAPNCHQIQQQSHPPCVSSSWRPHICYGAQPPRFQQGVQNGIPVVDHERK